MTAALVAALILAAQIAVSRYSGFGGFGNWSPFEE